ncbi:hypothetical protein O7621_24175 [Solwaraspora sp. WMMD937]|uniref:hypothetical protein n=1 Tax=Solwaraspora sp. WMMD937 TaxID=3016090 RepID=UPI00249A576C|nr:hypothetical protein [Solwaraspora sp. WMMD937]WFE20933.1 hypothetical protein O7621_24175 [Solwaraspora sp. WMMD937]
MSTVIVPAGLSMGPRYRYVRPPDPNPECYEVHLGDDLVELTETEAAVWAAAFLYPDQHAKLTVNRNSLVRMLETAPKPEPHAARYVDDLIARGLLVEFDPDGDLQPVFSRHKLLPLAQGLGATPEAPHQHRIGIGDHALVALPVDVYGLWSFSYRDENLWRACVLYADDSENIEDGDKPMSMTPSQVARDIAGHLPLLIAAGCAFLDPVAAA